MTASRESSVYLVDDDATVRDSLCAVLETYDFAVSEYCSAEAFIAVLPSDGCLVTDINMPGMSGIELLEELQNCQSAIVTIAVTASDDAHIWEKAERAGAVALFAKPADIDVLAQTIERCLRPFHQTERTGHPRIDGGNPPKVLIAEDNLMVADRLEETLIASGYNVCGIARTVEEGIAIGKMYKPDIAILDVRLANGGVGVDIARQLCGTTKCAVLYVTGDHSRNSALTTADGNASIAKPYHSDDILRAVEIIREVAATGVAALSFPSGFRLLSAAL